MLFRIVICFVLVNIVELKIKLIILGWWAFATEGRQCFRFTLIENQQQTPLNIVQLIVRKCACLEPPFKIFKEGRLLDSHSTDAILNKIHKALMPYLNNFKEYISRVRLFLHIVNISETTLTVIKLIHWLFLKGDQLKWNQNITVIVTTFLAPNLPSSSVVSQYFNLTSRQKTTRNNNPRWVIWSTGRWGLQIKASE